MDVEHMIYRPAEWLTTRQSTGRRTISGFRFVVEVLQRIVAFAGERRDLSQGSHAVYPGRCCPSATASQPYALLILNNGIRPFREGR